MEHQVGRTADIFDNWPGKLGSLWPVLIGGVVLIGGGILLSYLYILGIESVFPLLLDKTSLFIFMAAMTGILTFYLAFSFTFPLFAFSAPEIPGRHWMFRAIVVTFAMMIAWNVPMLAVALGWVGWIGFLFVFVVLLATAVCLLAFCSQDRAPGSQWPGWLWFLLTGFLSATLFSWILMTGFPISEYPSGEHLLFAVVTVGYAAFWMGISAARRRGQERWKTYVIVVIGFAGMIIIHAHEAIFIAAGKFAKIERSNQKVLLPSPLPPEILLAQPGNVTLTKPVKGQADNSSQTWLHFATSFHFGSLDVLCNPKPDAKGRPIAADDKGNPIAEICLVVRDSKPLSTFDRVRLDEGTGSEKTDHSPDADRNQATSSHTLHHDRHAAR